MVKKKALHYFLTLSLLISQISPFPSISFAQPVTIGTGTTATTTTCTTGTCTTTTGTTTTGGTSSDFLSGNNTLSATTTTTNPQTQQSPDDIFEADRQSNGTIVVRRISVSPPTTVVTLSNTQTSFIISNKAIYYGEQSPSGGVFLRARNLTSPNTVINYNGNQPMTSVQFDARMPGVATVTLTGQTQLVDLEAVQGSLTKITNITINDSPAVNKAFTVLESGPKPLVLWDLSSGNSTRIAYTNKIWNARVSDDFAFAFVAGTSPTDLTSSSFQYIPLNATNKTLLTPQVQVGTNLNGTPILAALSSLVNIASGSFTEFLPANQVKFIGTDFKDYVFNLSFNLATNVVTLTPVAPVGVTLTAAAPVAGTPNLRLNDIRQQVFLNLLGREPDAETLRNFYYSNQTIAQIQDQVRLTNEYFVRTMFVSIFGAAAVQSYYNPASATNPIFNKYSDFVTKLDPVYRDWLLGLDTGTLPGTAPLQTINRTNFRSKVFEHLTNPRYDILYDAYDAALLQTFNTSGNAGVVNKLYADILGRTPAGVVDQANVAKWLQALNVLGYVDDQSPLLSPRILIAQLFIKANTAPNNGTAPDLIQVTPDKTDLVISSGNQLTWYQVTTSNSKLTFKRQVTHSTQIENISAVNTGVYVDGGTTLTFIPFSSPTATITTPIPNIQNVQFIAGLRGVADIVQNGVTQRINLAETGFPTILQTIASPDGKHILLRQSNHKIVVWHLVTNTFTSLAYPEEIWNIQASNDGFYIAGTTATDLTSSSFKFFSFKTNTLLSPAVSLPSGVTVLSGSFTEFLAGGTQVKFVGQNFTQAPAVFKDYVFNLNYNLTTNVVTPAAVVPVAGTPNLRLNDIRQQVFRDLLGREPDAETLRNFYYSNQTIAQIQDQVRLTNEYFVRTMFVSIFGAAAVQSYYNPASATNPIFNKYSDFVTKLDLVYRDWLLGLDSGTLPGTAPLQPINRTNLRAEVFEHLTDLRYQPLFDAYEALLLQTLSTSGNTGVINKLYADILGRTPVASDQANVTAWTNTLAKFRFLGTPPTPPATTVFDRKEDAVDSIWQLFRARQGQSIPAQMAPDTDFVVTFDNTTSTFTLYKLLATGKFGVATNSPKTIQVAYATSFSVGNEGIHVAGVDPQTGQFVKVIRFANFPNVSAIPEFDFNVGVPYAFLGFVPDMPGIMEVIPVVPGYSPLRMDLEGTAYRTDGNSGTTNNPGTWDSFSDPGTSPNGDIIVSTSGFGLVVRDRNFNTRVEKNWIGSNVPGQITSGSKWIESFTVVNGGVFVASEYILSGQPLLEFIRVTPPAASSGVLTVANPIAVPLPFPAGISMLAGFLVDFFANPTDPTGNSVYVEIVGKGSLATDNRVYRFNLTVQPNGQLTKTLVTSFTNARTALIGTIRQTFRAMTEPSREPSANELRSYLSVAEFQNFSQLQLIDNISIALMSQYFYRQFESTHMEWQARQWANRVGTFIGYLQPNGTITSTQTVGSGTAGGTTGTQVVLGNVNGNPIYGPTGGYVLTNMNGVSTVYDATGQQVAVYNASGQVISTGTTTTGTPLYYTWGTLNVASQWNPPQNVKQYIKNTYGSYPPPASFSVNAAANEQTAYAEYLMTSTLSTLHQNNPTLPWSALVNLAILQTQQAITHLTNNPPTGFAAGFLPSTIPGWVQLQNTILSRLQQLLAHPPGN